MTICLSSSKNFAVLDLLNIIFSNQINASFICKILPHSPLSQHKAVLYELDIVEVVKSNLFWDSISHLLLSLIKYHIILKSCPVKLFQSAVTVRTRLLLSDVILMLGNV